MCHHSRQIDWRSLVDARSKTGTESPNEDARGHSSEANIPNAKDLKSAKSAARHKFRRPRRKTQRHRATGATDRACHHQAARSGLSGRLAIIRSKSSIAGDPEDPQRRPYTILRQGRWTELVTIRQLGQGCRGGSLLSEASRRLPRTQKTQHASSAPSPHPTQVRRPASQRIRHYATGATDQAC